MQVQFNSDNSVMGTENVAERIEAKVREKLGRFEDRLTRLEIHVADEHRHTHGHDDKACTIEARPRGGKPIGVTEHASTVDDAARKAANTLAQRLTRHFGKSEKNRHEARPDKVL
jgi:ribosome-associated translation inhibitor RaiA